MRKVAGGQVKALLVFGNSIADFSEEETERLLANVPFVVQVGTNEGVVSRAAHAVLPSASFVERGGTFTNHAGRVQRFWIVITSYSIHYTKLYDWYAKAGSQS